MSIPSISTTDTMNTFRTTFNALALDVGDLSLLQAEVLAATNPDDLVQAINEVYRLAVLEDNDFENHTDFNNTITVDGLATFAGNVRLNGNLNFDGSSVNVTSILDEDDMSSDSATALVTQQSTKAFVDNYFTTEIGGATNLSAAIKTNIGTDNIVNAVNYVYTLAILEDNDFENHTDFNNTITVDGLATFGGNVRLNANLNFDGSSVNVTSILDEDDMSSDSATSLVTQQSVKAYVDNTFTSEVGGASNLNTTIKTNIGDDNVVNAINYVYTVATTEDNDFANATTFADSITVTGNSTFENNLTVDGNFGFDAGVTVNTILDQDTLSSNSATALATQQSIKAYVDNRFTTDVGAISGLDAGILANANPDTIVNAINYVLSVATQEESNFANAVTFSDNVTIGGFTSLAGNVDIDGTLTFDGTGPSITSFVDEDNMASNSNTAVPTQQSVKAYVDTEVTAATTGAGMWTSSNDGSGSGLDADLLDGIDSSGFLRSAADDIKNSDTYLQFGSATAGAVRVEHDSTNDITYFRPHDGVGFDAAKEFGWDGPNDRWFFDEDLFVGGTFTSTGIDDNATANRVQIENSLVTIKTAATVQGALTTTGNVQGPSSGDFLVTNTAGEYLELDGTNNTASVYAGGLLGLNASATAVQLYYAGSSKLATSNTGVSVTGDLTVTSDFVGPAAFRVSNSGNDYIDITASSIDTYVNATKRLGVTASGAAVTGTLSATGAFSAGAATLSGNLTGGSTFTIDNGSTEKVRFTTSSVILEVNDTDRLTVGNGTVTVTGDLDVTGNITGTFDVSNLGDITTGTISSGAITSSGNLTLTAGDIIVPTSASTDVTNGSGELIRFNNTNNRTELFAGGTQVLYVQSSGTVMAGNVTFTGTDVDVGNGDEYITFNSTNSRVTVVAGDNQQVLVNSDTVALRHSGTQKLITTATGISVSGDVQLTDDILMQSGIADAQITNSNGEYITFNDVNNRVEIGAGGNEGIEVQAASVILRYTGGTRLTTTSGGVSVTGALTASGDVTAFSDWHLKEKVSYTPMESPLETINKLEGIAYKWNDKFHDIDPNADLDKTRVGVYAQDIAAHFDAALGAKNGPDDKYLTVRYEALIPLIIEAIKEISKKL